MKYEIYGIKFRKLRKQQHLSLKQAAEGVTFIKKNPCTTN